jgi:hypothetical protein
MGCFPHPPNLPPPRFPILRACLASKFPPRHPRSLFIEAIIRNHSSRCPTTALTSLTRSQSRRIVRPGKKWRHCTSSRQKTKTRTLKVESRNYTPPINLPPGVAPANRWKLFQPSGAAFPFVPAGGSVFRGAESAHEKDGQAYQQQQANPAAADDGAAKVKPAAAEQEQQNHHE